MWGDLKTAYPKSVKYVKNMSKRRFARTPGTPRLDAQTAKYSFAEASSVVASEYLWLHINATGLLAMGDREGVGDREAGDWQNNFY